MLINNSNMYEKFLKMNMLYLLLEELENISQKKFGEVYIFLYNKENLFSDLMPNKKQFIKNNILSIVLGGEYEFKKLKFYSNYLSVNLANENGDFFSYKIPYNYIIGFYKNKFLIKYHSILYDEESINLEDIKEFKKNLPNNLIDINSNSHLIKYNFITEFLIKKSIEDLINNSIEENHIIKITFLEKFKEIEELNSNMKLLVVIIDDDSWKVKLENNKIILNVNHSPKEVIIPIENIVTYMDTQNSLLLNRYIKLMNDNFEEIDFLIYEKNNLVFVDFNSLLEEENINDLSYLFNLDNLFKNISNEVEENEETNNLIVGNFTEIKDNDIKDDKDKD